MKRTRMVRTPTAGTLTAGTPTAETFAPDPIGPTAPSVTLPTATTPSDACLVALACPPIRAASMDLGLTLDVPLPRLRGCRGVYALVHLPSQRFYIGSTVGQTGIAGRIWTHGRDLRQGTHANPRLQRLWCAHTHPTEWICLPLAVLPAEAVRDAEARLLGALVGHPQCLNVNPSAIGMSSEQARAQWADPQKREHMVASLRQHLADPVARAAHAARARALAHDPVLRADAAVRQRARMTDPEARNAIGRATRGRMADPDARARQAEHTRTQMADPARRERLADLARGRARDPEYAQRIREAVAAANARPEVRAARSAAATARYRAPAERAKQAERARAAHRASTTQERTAVLAAQRAQDPVWGDRTAAGRASAMWATFGVPAFRAPDGAIHRDVRNLRAFARAHGLSSTLLSRMWRGLATQTKGWTPHRDPR